jgi:4-hydroxybenzoate polyprenyltransferase/phosphoserine phosphatase
MLAARLMVSDPSLEGALCEDGSTSRPICIALDGALVSTDTLWENIVLLLRHRPWLGLLVPFWLRNGPARFKERIARSVPLDPATLPYRAELLQAAQRCHDKGRSVVLVSSTNRGLAERISEHLGFFDSVYASDASSNLKGERKRAALTAAFPDGFDYVSASSNDAPVFASATRGYLVGASAGAIGATRRMQQVRVVSKRPSILRALIKELRVHQWAKNALVLLPVVLAPTIPSPQTLLRALLAFATFSLSASAGYVFNDLLDLDADRAHPTKAKRPFASGALPVAAGPPLFAALLVMAFAVASLALPPAFLAMLAIYFLGTLSYSLYLKRILMLDVLVLAGLYTHRILSGGMATDVRVSAWLLGFSMFFFTSLAFAKRYVELNALSTDDQIKNRGYFKVDLQMVTSMGTASGYIAAMVFMLYVESTAVRGAYREPGLLWLVLPVLLYWLGRIWLLAGRGQMQDDPVKFALKDGQSLLCGAIIIAIAALARFTPEALRAFLH